MRASIEELASFVDQYQGGHVADAEKHVTRWLKMFDQPDAVADELAHVLGRSFLTRDQAAAEIAEWFANPKKVSRGLISSWDEAKFLDAARGGGSQRDVLDLFDEAAAENDEEPIRSRSGERVYVYADDVSVHGMRLLNDLTPWMKSDDAPDEFDLLLLLQRRLAGKETYLGNELRSRAKAAGKTARIRWWCNEDFVSGDGYCPAAIPDSEDVAAWMAETGAKTPTLRTGTAAGRFFSSDAARRMIESEFLIAGARILRTNRNLQQKKYMRPLGKTIWSTAPLGLGVPIVTWRNCPNSAPLALWAEGIVDPLFPRQSN